MTLKEELAFNALQNIHRYLREALEDRSKQYDNIIQAMIAAGAASAMLEKPNEIPTSS